MYVEMKPLDLYCGSCQIRVNEEIAENVMNTSILFFFFSLCCSSVVMVCIRFRKASKKGHAP